MADRRKQTGRRGEDIAAAYLLQNGYTIVTRNWRCEYGELDIVARQSDVLVFVEVRTRRGDRFGTPEESITPAKQARLVDLAQAYLQQSGDPPPRWRIDVVAVQLGAGAAQVNHIENAVGWGFD